MSRELLRPQINVPLVVSLDFGADGIAREGQYGTDYMYTCNEDAAVLFLPPSARDALQRANVQPGEEIAITKRKAGRSVTWEVDRVEEEPAGAYEPPAQTPARPAPTPRQQAQNAATQAARPAPAQTQPTPRTAVQQPTPAATQLASALCAAIDACVEAETYAQRKGLKLQFEAGDLRAMALSIFIGNQRKDVR